MLPLSALQIQFNLDCLAFRHLNGSNSSVGQPILAVPLFFPRPRIVNSSPASLRSLARSASPRYLFFLFRFLASQPAAAATSFILDSFQR